MDKISNKVKNSFTVNWLKTRSQGQVSDKYLLNDQQWEDQQMMKKIFISMDRDNSNSLDRNELFQMFQNFGINMKLNDLREFFLQIDEDYDNTLSWNEFKSSVTNNEASIIFMNIMKRLRQEKENELKKNNMKFLDDVKIKKESDNNQKIEYLPLNFIQLVQFLNYNALRQDIIESIGTSEDGLLLKFKKCQDLIQLGERCYNMKKEVRQQEFDINDQVEEKNEKNHHKLQKVRRNNELKKKINLDQRLYVEKRIRQIEKINVSNFSKEIQESSNLSPNSKSQQKSKEKSSKKNIAKLKLLLQKNQKINSEKSEENKEKQKLEEKQQKNLGESTGINKQDLFKHQIDTKIHNPFKVPKCFSYLFRSRSQVKTRSPQLPKIDIVQVNDQMKFLSNSFLNSSKINTKNVQGNSQKQLNMEKRLSNIKSLKIDKNLFRERSNQSSQRNLLNIPLSEKLKSIDTSIDRSHSIGPSIKQISDKRPQFLNGLLQENYQYSQPSISDLDKDSQGNKKPSQSRLEIQKGSIT